MILAVHSEYPQSQTYVLKLRRDAVSPAGAVAGRLEHVASGRQYPFESADELIDCLMRAAVTNAAGVGGQPS